MIDQLTRQLRGEEDEILHEYKDHMGYSTIGCGRLIDQRKGGGITREESAYLLANDIARRSKEVHSRLPWTVALDDARRAVLIQMAFQMGVDGLLKFKNALRKIQAGDYAGAAVEMLDSTWARQTPARSQRMAEQMRTGVWQYKPGF